MKWEYEKIGNCCDITSSKRVFLSEYVKSGVPFYRSKEIIERSLGQEISEPLFISKQKYDEFKKRFGVPCAGDMLLTSVGTIGIPYIVKPSDCFYFKDGNLTWFRGFSDKLSSEFLYNWIKSSDGQGVLNNSTIGSSQKALTISTIKQIKIPLPPRTTQNRIVEIVSQYDNLIENNQKQIKLLEEAAQRLYKEWFVDLRFPGHETTPIVDGLPEEWEKNCANHFFDITIGKTPPRAEKQWFTKSEGVPWSSISDMGNSGIFVFNTTECLTEEAVSKHNVKKIPNGTVILSFKLTVGRVSITATEMCTNEAIAHFYVNDDTRYYTYLYLKMFPYDELGNTSSISKAINSKIVKSMPFIMPSTRVLNDFNKTVVPIFSQICCLQKQIRNLTEARNRLLPKLMNGEILV